MSSDQFDSLLNEVHDELSRQLILKREGKFPFTCHDEPGHTDPEKLSILAEEFGEVSREVNESITRNIQGTTTQETKEGMLRTRAELIQVAAVAVSWVAGLDKQLEKMND